MGNKYGEKRLNQFCADASMQFVSAWIQCIFCWEEHLSVHPIVCHYLECPHCGYMTPLPESYMDDIAHG